MTAPDAPREAEVRKALASLCVSHPHFTRLAGDVLALLDAGRKDRERVDWLEQAAADPLEIDNFGAGVGEPDERDRVFLTWANSGERITSATTLRAAIDRARGA